MRVCMHLPGAVVDVLRFWINSAWTVRRKGIQKPMTLEHLGWLSFNFSGSAWWLLPWSALRKDVIFMKS